MDWRTLFLSPRGRINRREFWLGFVLLLVASLVLGAIPILRVAGPLLLWPQLCIHSKRLHDMGRGAWWLWVPFGLAAVCAGGTGVLAGAALLGGLTADSHSGGEGSSEFEGASMPDMGGAGVVMGLALVCGLCFLLCGLGFLLWVGLTPGEPDPNRYGPPPGPRADVPVG